MSKHITANEHTVGDLRDLFWPIIGHRPHDVSCDEYDHVVAEKLKELSERGEEEADIREACQLMADFYTLDTEPFIEKYGVGVTPRDVGNRAHAVLAIAKTKGK